MPLFPLTHDAHTCCRARRASGRHPLLAASRLALLYAFCCAAHLGGGETVRPLEAQVRSATERVYPALLYIQPITEDYSGGRKKQVVSSGSGVIISNDGLALTNYHVAGHAKYLQCTLSNKEQVEASLVGGDPATDVAVLQLATEQFNKVKPDGFKPAALGDSDRIVAGQYVLAMGSPFGYDRSVSLGIVSCADRFLPDGATLPTGEATGIYNTWIQTDAAINPGNSGGPLVDLSGRVVGLNARVVFYGNSIGFAIPINIVKDIQAQIIRFGRVRRSRLGLTLQHTVDLEPKLGRRIDGVLIAGVVAGSPAARAGIEAGDLLLKVNGTPLSARHRSELPAARRLLASLPINQSATFTLIPLSGGAVRETEVQVAEQTRNQGQDAECPEWGVTVKELTPDMQRRLRTPISDGIMVYGVQPGSPADLAGLALGDVIVRIEAEPVFNMESFNTLFDKSVRNRTPQLALTAYRGMALQYILLRPSFGGQPQEEQQ